MTSRDVFFRLEHTLQTVPACNSADFQESPSIPTQFAAAWGYVVTPALWVHVGCWNVPWMTWIWLVEGVLLTEPHQLLLLAVGFDLRILRWTGVGLLPPMRVRPNSKGSSLISDCGMGTPFFVASTVKVSSARAWLATRAEPNSAARVHRMVRARKDEGGCVISEVL